MELIQDDLIIPLIHKNYLRGTRQKQESLEVELPSLGLKEGSATFCTNVRDYSWRPGGNKKKEEISITVDTRPPIISVLSRFHYLNQGGTGLIIYKTSEKLTKTGIEAGGNWFSGFEVENGKFLSFFAVPHDSTDQTTVILVSEDLAGNQTHTHFPYSIKPKKFQSATLYIDDGFLRNVMPYFMERDSSLTGDLAEVFLKVNRNLRKSNFAVRRRP